MREYRNGHRRHFLWKESALYARSASDYLLLFPFSLQEEKAHGRVIRRSAKPSDGTLYCVRYFAVHRVCSFVVSGLSQLKVSVGKLIKHDLLGTMSYLTLARAPSTLRLHTHHTLIAQNSFALSRLILQAPLRQISEPCIRVFCSE